MMYRIVSYGPKTPEENEIFLNWDSAVDEWKKDFQELHRFREMRIYPHVIVDHGKDIYERHGALTQYSQQGMEHANKRDILSWHRHTQRGGGSGAVCTLSTLFTTTHR